MKTVHNFRKYRKSKIETIPNIDNESSLDNPKLGPSIIFLTLWAYSNLHTKKIFDNVDL